MQQGRNSSGGQGLPARAAEEQATTRGRKMVRKAFQDRIFLRACIRFCPGTAYIVIVGCPVSFSELFNPCQLQRPASRLVVVEQKSLGGAWGKPLNRSIIDLAREH